MSVIPQFSDACRQLAKKYELCRLMPYDDARPAVALAPGAAVEGTLTAGWGHTGPDVEIGVLWTEPRADAALDEDLQAAWNEMHGLVRVDLTQGQADGLTDFVFNEGSGRLAESTLLRELNLGQYANVPAEIERWDYAGGEISDGLKARRADEVALWNSQQLAGS